MNPSSSSTASSSAALESWAIPSLEHILPIDQGSLTTIVQVAATEHGGPEGAGRYLRELLGESEVALNFIAEFTRRMRTAAQQSGRGGSSGVGCSMSGGFLEAGPTPTGASGSRSTPVSRTGTPPVGLGRPSTPKESLKKPVWSVADNVPAVKRKLGVNNRGGKVVGHGYRHEMRQANDGLPAMGVETGQGVKAYRKKEEEDSYYTGGKKGGNGGGGGEGGSGGNSGAVTPQKGITPTPTPVLPLIAAASGVEDAGGGRGNKKQQPQQQQQQKNKQQGTLTYDLLQPKPRHKISATTSTMRAPSSSPLTDLESALRALEMTTNPTTYQDGTKRLKCNCIATKHDLLLAAPNCLSCGKVICIKEGPGPCTFCGAPLLSSEETQAMISFLREERGREKMEATNRANRKPEVAKGTTKPYSSTPPPPHLGFGYGTPGTGDDDAEAEAAALARAKAHRDKLLAFQAHNAQRTKIIDEAADFDTSAVESMGYGGLSAWASPQERALQLKKQQKRMREVQWAAKEDWEKRRVVVSIDISGKGKGGKGGVTVRREMREVEMYEGEVSEGEEEIVDVRAWTGQASNNAGAEIEIKAGRYARNPLLKGYIKPVYTPSSSTITKPTHPTAASGRAAKGKQNVNDDYTYTDDGDSTHDDDYENEDDEIPEIVRERRKGGWRRVLQDDLDLEGNEKWILDGSVGRAEPDTGMEKTQEPACG